MFVLGKFGVRAVDLLSEFKKAHEVGSLSVLRRFNSKWLPPNKDTVKINVDAAVNIKENKFGIGIMARNVADEVMMAAAKTCWPFVSVELAELAAVQWAVELVQDRFLLRVLIEGDAQVVVKALQRKIKRGLHSHVVVDNIIGLLVLF